jgi:C1A family cysteine protease
MNYKILLLLIAFILCLSNTVCADNINHQIRSSILNSFLQKPKNELFKVYHFLFKKEYDLNSQEGVKRFEIFKNTLTLVEETNSKNLSYKLGINKFSDLSNEEFKSRYLSFKEEIHSELSFLSEKSYFDVHADAEDELSIDLTQSRPNWTRNFGPAKDQGSCGSCWAFAAIGAVEGNYSVKFGKELRFAEQELVDCSQYTNGCRGSSPASALRYVLESGIAYENSYEYISGLTRSANTCKSKEVPRNMILTGTSACNSRTCTRALVRNLLSQGPLVSLIDGEGNGIYKNYASGILEMPCSEDNHAIIMTGLDVDSSGREYYLGRNSWGSDWGENGNFKLYVRDSDRSCYMESYVILPLVKETSTPVPPPPQPQCVRFYSECNLKGKVSETCTSVSEINTNVAGFTIGKFKEVRIFPQPKCVGSFYKLNSGYGCLSESGVKDAIKSIYIKTDEVPPKGCIWVFDDYCLAGNKKEICSDINDLSILNFENKISSIQFGADVNNIRVFAQRNYGRPSSTLNATRLSLLNSSLDKNIESIQFNR